MKRIIVILTFLTLGLIAYACGGGTSSTTPGTAGLTDTGSPLPDSGRSVSSADELIYISNGSNPSGYQGLHAVTIYGDGTATATKIAEFPTEWGGSHIGASPDGSKLYCLQNSAKRFGIWDVATGEMTLVKEHGILGVTMAAVAPDGTIYAGVQNSQGGTLYGGKLFRVDPDTGDMTDLGRVYAGPGMTNAISFSGGDIAFDAYGNFFLLTNWGKKLYLVTYNEAGYYEGDPLWNTPPSTNFSGLAIRDNGAGDLLASAQVGNGLYVINPVGYSWTVHSWTGGYSHDQGDMSVGLFGYPDPPYETETGWGEGTSFGKGWAMYFEFVGDTVTVDLLAGRHMDAGDVTAEIDGDNLVVSYATDGWALVDSHLYVGTSAPTKSAPGKFPYHHSDSVDGVYTIPLSDIDGYDAGDTIYIAAHAVVRHYVGY